MNMAAHNTQAIVLPGQLLSNGYREFIISVLRTYPRMMMRAETLPPFVHPIGCGLHFSKDEGWQLDVGPSAVFTTLKPLAACMSIAHIFSSRTANTETFLWRTVESEQRWIRHEVRSSVKFVYTPRPRVLC
jgi:hypothetical protein